jgi:hypothetical protein
VPRIQWAEVDAGWIDLASPPPHPAHADACATPRSSGSSTSVAAIRSRSSVVNAPRPPTARGHRRDRTAESAVPEQIGQRLRGAPLGQELAHIQEPGAVRTYLEADAPRVPEHLVMVAAAVPGVRLGTHATYALEDTCVSLTGQIPKFVR